MLKRIRELAIEPVASASLRAFRFMFGLLLCGALARSWQKGVIEQAFVAPQLHFAPYGLSFVRSPGESTYTLYAGLFVLSLCLACGLAPRFCAALLGLGFSYAHFVDLTHYLNHYYLVSLLCGLLASVPIGPRVSPRWALWLFRFQFGVVYFFGGVAKLKHDWLFHAEPLRTWLAANTDLPLLGSLFSTRWAPFAFSWLGALYDLTITFWLLARRTRPYAYAAVVSFHVLTAQLFQIGLFPWLMIAGSLLFLEPDWPRRIVPERIRVQTPEGAPEVFSFGAKHAVPIALYVTLQVMLPLRHWFYPGNLLWHEQGYRFAWNVMLMEKTGSAEFIVEDRDTRQRRVISPRALLTRAQTKAFATQPDMILAFAQEVGRREHALGHDVAVYADAWVVLNGRAPARLIDPNVDLLQHHDGFANKSWILPAPP